MSKLGKKPTNLKSKDLVVVVHHTAANDVYSNAASLKTHFNETGLGYNGVVDDDEANQNPAKGRDGKATYTQQVADDDLVWGATGANSYGWHVAIDGNCEERPPTEDEFNMLVQVIATKVRSWGWKKVDALGDPKRKKRSRIYSHQEVGRHLAQVPYFTACPGKHLIARMDELRRRVAAYLPD